MSEVTKRGRGRPRKDTSPVKELKTKPVPKTKTFMEKIAAIDIVEPAPIEEPVNNVPAEPFRPWVMSTNHLVKDVPETSEVTADPKNRGSITFKEILQQLGRR